MNVNGQYTDKEISKYRKQLFEVLRESEQTNLSRVIAHYGMKSTEIKDIWDAVLMLEICGDLEDDNDKIKHFESLLKISSKEALTDQIVEVIVDSTGGTLHLKDEDIKLEIHSEAIEGEEVKVTLEIFSEEIDIPISHPRESIISPIIKCGPEGTTFNKPISLSFPHDAVNEENWEFTLLVKDHIQDEWKQIALTNDRKDVHFTLNKGLCCITLNHFSWYALKGHVRNAVHAKKRMLLGVFGKMLANDEYQLQTRLCKPSDVKKIKEDHRETGEQLLRPPVDLLFMYKKMKITVAAVSEQEWNVQDENVQTVTAEYLWRGTPLKTFLLRRSNSLENVLKATVSLSQESNRIDPVPVYCDVETTRPNPGVPSSTDVSSGASVSSDTGVSSGTGASDQCIKQETRNPLTEKLIVLNDDLSEVFTKNKRKLLFLRCCLNEHVELQVLCNKHYKVKDYFNDLSDKAKIKPTDVSLLLEIARLSEIQEAEDVVQQYMRDNNVQNTDQHRLSPYRKRLCKALTQFNPNELNRINAFYELELPTIWDVTFELERKGKLRDESQRKKFADLLGAIPKEILYGQDDFSFASLQSVNRSSQQGSQQPHRRQRIPTEYWVALICILVAVFAVYIYGNIKTLFLYFVAIVILVVFIGYLCDKLWKFYTQNRGC